MKISLRLSEADMLDLEVMAERLGCTKSNVIREALRMLTYAWEDGVCYAAGHWLVPEDVMVPVARREASRGVNE